MKAIAQIFSILTALAVVLIVLTLVATERSRERAACYRTIVDSQKCPSPNSFDETMRRLFG